MQMGISIYIDGITDRGVFKFQENYIFGRGMHLVDVTIHRSTYLRTLPLTNKSF